MLAKARVLKLIHPVLKLALRVYSITLDSTDDSSTCTAYGLTLVRDIIKSTASRAPELGNAVALV